MKNIKLSVVALLTQVIFFTACSNRKDIVFSAFDELHYIISYEKKSEFELLYNGFNTAERNNILQGDTIILTYTPNQFKEFEANEVLSSVILIQTKANRVTSIDDKMPFCANIKVDKRKKIYQ